MHYNDSIDYMNDSIDLIRSDSSASSQLWPCPVCTIETLRLIMVIFLLGEDGYLPVV